MTRSTFEDHFSSQAGRYAAARPTYTRELVRWLSEQAPGHTRCWDAGTGSGQVAVLASEFFEEVFATDASVQQLSEAPRRGGIAYRVEQAEAPSLKDHSVDAVLVGAAAHWFDLPAFYEAVRRVSRPNAVVGLFSYGTKLADEPELQKVLDTYFSRVLGPWCSERLDLVNSEYRTLDFPFREVRLPTVYAESYGDLTALKDLLRTWSAAQRMALATGEDPIAHVDAELDAAWLQRGSLEDARRLKWPVFGRVGHV